MSNVIPQEGREVVARMYRARYVIAGGLIMLATALLAGLSIFPSYLALNAAPTPANSSPSSAASDSDRAAVAQTQALLGAIGPLLSATTSPTDAISLALALRGSGVTVNHVAFTAGVPDVLVLSGNAATPAEIDAYRKALAAQSLFANVSIPVGDLIGSQDGSFSVTLQGNF